MGAEGQGGELGWGREGVGGRKVVEPGAALGLGDKIPLVPAQVGPAWTHRGCIRGMMG